MFYVLLCITLCPLSFYNHFNGEGKLVALLCLSSCCLKSFTTLPHDAMGLSAVCDCGIS